MRKPSFFSYQEINLVLLEERKQENFLVPPLNVKSGNKPATVKAIWPARI